MLLLNLQRNTAPMAASARRDSVILAGWQQREALSPTEHNSATPDLCPDVSDLHACLAHGYEVVKDPSRQVRLCRILATTGLTALALERATFYLSDVQGQYIALSYTWAGMDLDEEVWVNGIQIRITRNLYTQLCRLRALGCDALLWIDILSIHQSDEVEKSAQVALMSEIFRSPKTVYVALDDRTDSVHQDKAEHALIAIAIQELAGGKHFCDLSCFHDRATHIDGPETAERLLYRILNATYWERVWVVQEVVLAPACDILLASGFVPWRSLADAVEQLNVCREADCCSAFFKRRGPRLQEAIHRVRRCDLRRSRSVQEADEACRPDVGIHPHGRS